MQCTPIYNIVVTQGPVVLIKLLASMDKSLLIKGNTLFVQYHIFQSFNCIAASGIKNDCLAGVSLEKEHKVPLRCMGGEGDFPRHKFSRGPFHDLLIGNHCSC